MTKKKKMQGIMYNLNQYSDKNVNKHVCLGLICFKEKLSS